MGEIEKHKKISVLLLILLVFSILIIGLLISTTVKINNLDEMTLKNLSNCLLNSGCDLEQGEEITQILTDYEDERGKIDKTSLNNGLLSLLITLLFILTSIKKIIRTIKSILKDIFNGKDNHKENNCRFENIDRKELLIKFGEYKQLKELIEQLDINEEKDKQQDERIMILERTMLRILEDFVLTLGQTSNYTKKIDKDKELIEIGMSEINKGLEQISNVINYDENNQGTMTREELMAAVEQINSAMKETGTLIKSMDRSVKALSTHVQVYKEGKKENP